MILCTGDFEIKRVTWRSRAFMTSPMGAGTALCPAKPGSKSKNARRSSIYARFCVFPGMTGVILRLRGGRRPRAKQPRPQTSVAGTARQNSGQNRQFHLVTLFNLAPNYADAYNIILRIGLCPAKPGSKSKNARRSSIHARFCVFRGMTGVIHPLNY